MKTEDRCPYASKLVANCRNEVSAYCSVMNKRCIDFLDYEDCEKYQITRKLLKEFVINNYLDK